MEWLAKTSTKFHLIRDKYERRNKRVVFVHGTFLYEYMEKTWIRSYFLTLVYITDVWIVLLSVCDRSFSIGYDCRNDRGGKLIALFVLPVTHRWFLTISWQWTMIFYKACLRLSPVALLCSAIPQHISFVYIKTIWQEFILLLGASEKDRDRDGKRKIQLSSELAEYQFLMSISTKHTHTLAPIAI